MPLSFSKLSYKEINGGLINAHPNENLKCIVVIPAFAEDAIHHTLDSLCASCYQHDEVEIIVLINQSISVLTEYAAINQKCYELLQDYICGLVSIHIVFVHEIPDKIAGVGTARKLAMDEAVRRFSQIQMTRTGIIVNLDADCTVSSNYFEALISFFDQSPKIELANIHFEHKLSDCKDEIGLMAITDYELHLRYFIGMQRWLSLPYAYQTVGSAFAVRVEAYVQIGGMNRKKAGEDFYFIHKFTKKGTATNLAKCVVFPSGRSSFRVPFGTGRAVQEIKRQKAEYKTYHPQSFVDIKSFIDHIDEYYMGSVDWTEVVPEWVFAYLKSQDFNRILQKLKSNSKSLITFRKAFFQWFDAFRLMKYLHFVRDQVYDNLPVGMALKEASHILNIDANLSNGEMLTILRARNIVSDQKKN